MTVYLADIRRKLLERFEALPDVEENVASFYSIADLIQWIDTHPQATRDQYLVQMQAVKLVYSEPVMSRRVQ